MSNQLLTNYANYVITSLIVPKEPVLFLKPTSSYLGVGGTIEIPHPLESLHHEVELAVVIGKKARDVPEASAMDYVAGSYNFINKLSSNFILGHTSTK